MYSYIHIMHINMKAPAYGQPSHVSLRRLETATSTRALRRMFHHMYGVRIRSTDNIKLFGCWFPPMMLRLAKRSGRSKKNDERTYVWSIRWSYGPPVSEEMLFLHGRSGFLRITVYQSTYNISYVVIMPPSSTEYINQSPFRYISRSP